MAARPAFPLDWEDEAPELWAFALAILPSVQKKKKGCMPNEKACCSVVGHDHGAEFGGL